VSEQELATIYTSATATILPSHYEGFGLPLLESMACGTPVICSDVASLSEIGNDSAFFINPSDEHDLSINIKKILNMNSKEKTMLSQKVIKHAAKYSWDKVVKETIKIYKAIANENNN